MTNDQSKTIDLLAQLRSGDDTALDRIIERALPPLRRYARTRLPRWARGMTDTQDLVQDVVVRALPRLRTFQAEGPGALQAFLRKAVANQIVDEIRKARHRRVSGDVPESMAASAPSPLDETMRRERHTRFRAALTTLAPSDQNLIRHRIGAGRSYAEVAQAVDKPNANAARVAVCRALTRLAQALARQESAGQRAGVPPPVQPRPAPRATAVCRS